MYKGIVSIPNNNFDPPILEFLLLVFLHRKIMIKPEYFRGLINFQYCKSHKNNFHHAAKFLNIFNNNNFFFFIIGFLLNHHNVLTTVI